jgi:hypothetical protein
MEKNVYFLGFTNISFPNICCQNELKEKNHVNWSTARWHLWSQSFKAIHCNSRITPPPFSSTDIFVEEKRGGVILLWQLMALIDWLHRCQLAGFMTHCFKELPDTRYSRISSKYIRKCHVLLVMDGYSSENIRIWKLCIRSGPIRISNINVPDTSWHE